MEFLRKLKDIFKEEVDNEKVKKAEKITLKDLPENIEMKRKENLNKEIKLKKEIFEILGRFYNDIEESMETLDKADPSKRKEHEKVKIIVQENLNLYKSYVKKLIYDLQETKSLEAKEFIKRISFLLDDFHRKSHTPYEKANFLVGKELTQAKGNIILLTRDFNELVMNNKSIFEEREAINQVNSKLSDLEETLKILEDIEKSMANSKSYLSGNERKIDELKKKIDEIKLSSQYDEDRKEEENQRNKLNEIDRELDAAKQKINFKLLAKIYHGNEKRSQLIKEYQKNFKMTIQNNENFEFISIVRETQGLDLEYLKDIINKVREYENPIITKTGREINGLEVGLNEIKSENNSIEETLKEDEKRRERLGKKKEEIFLKLKEFVKDVFDNVEFVE